MCPHDEFEIVLYKHPILIRKCQHCGQLEVCQVFWLEDADRLYGWLENIYKNHGPMQDSRLRTMRADGLGQDTDKQDNTQNE